MLLTTLMNMIKTNVAILDFFIFRNLKTKQIYLLFFNYI